MSLAGSVLVFHTELLLATQPRLAAFSPSASGEVMARLLADGAPRGLTALDLPREGLPVWQAYFADGSRAYHAPTDGGLLLVRSHDSDWLMWLHHWHVELLGGAVGKEVLGVAGWIAFGLLLGTLLTLFVVPALYVLVGRHAAAPGARGLELARQEAARPEENGTGEPAPSR